MKTKNTRIVAAEMSPLDVVEVKAGWLVTLAEVRALFGMSRTTVWRCIEDEMPVIRLPGSNRMRFELIEVQRWLEEKRRKRFARNGKKAILEVLRKRIAEIPVLNGIEVVEKGRGIEN